MDYKQVSDIELWQYCRDGNGKAFDVLFERYFNKLHFFALRYIRDYHLTEELVMDILTRLWEKKEILAHQGSLSGFLFKSLKNAIIDHLRKKSLDTVLLETTHEDVCVTYATDEHYNAKETHEVYLSNLSKLSPKRREVFELSREENKTYSQIAQQLNLSVKTVESHVSASLTILRKYMSDHLDSLILLFFLLNNFF